MQSTVSAKMGFGVPGEFYSQAPRRVWTRSVISTDAAPAVFGYMFSVYTDNVMFPGGDGTTGLAGILVSPKEHAIKNGITPSLTLPSSAGGIIHGGCEFARAGSIIIQVPGNVNIGDTVIYEIATGALNALPPGDALPSGWLNAHGIIEDFTASEGATDQVAVAYFNIPPTLLVAA